MSSCFHGNGRSPDLSCRCVSVAHIVERVFGFGSQPQCTRNGVYVAYVMYWVCGLGHLHSGRALSCKIEPRGVLVCASSDQDVRHQLMTGFPPFFFLFFFSRAS